MGHLASPHPGISLTTPSHTSKKYPPGQEVAAHATVFTGHHPSPHQPISLINGSVNLSGPTEIPYRRHTAPSYKVENGTPVVSA